MDTRSRSGTGRYSISHFHIAVQDRRPETAERMLVEIRSVIEKNAASQLPGHIHVALPDTWHYWIVKRWMIAFEIIADELIVHRIVDASRDLPRTFWAYVKLYVCVHPWLFYFVPEY